MSRQGRGAIGLTLAAGSLLALAACAVGPDIEAPDLSAQIPDSWLSAEDGAAQSDISAWWSLLGDAELTGLIERALVGSFDLAEARERVVAARARRGIANADRLPGLDAETFYERTQTGDESGSADGLPRSADIDVYSLGVVAGWELDLWGRVERLVEAADADIGAATEDFRAARVALAAEVARELVLIRSLDTERAIVASTILADRDALDIARSRADAGFADELDVARAARLLEANRAIVPGLDADRREAEFRLAVLLGETPGSVKITGHGLPRRDVVPNRGVPADLLLRRPDLRRAERELAAATARIGAAEAERYPAVALSGSLSLQGPDIGDAVNPEAYILRFGPSITLPIFRGGRIDSRVMEAESERRAALTRLRAATLAALSEVETAAMRRVRAEERVERFAAALAAAEDAERLSLDRYTAGAVDFLDVTEARSERLAIERDQTVAERDATLRLIDLYAALGGGWTNAPSAERQQLDQTPPLPAEQDLAVRPS